MSKFNLTLYRNELEILKRLANDLVKSTIEEGYSNCEDLKHFSVLANKINYLINDTMIENLFFEIDDHSIISVTNCINLDDLDLLSEEEAFKEDIIVVNNLKELKDVVR